MLGLGMWVFSATFNKNYFSYIMVITFTNEKNRDYRENAYFSRRHLNILSHRVYRRHLSP